MNKVSLLTIGKKLQDGSLYLLSIYDLEPSGLIVQAYDQVNSKEYLLPVSESEVNDYKILFDSAHQILNCFSHFVSQLAHAGVVRNINSLTSLIESIDLVPQGSESVLQSSIEGISNIKKRATGDELESAIKSPMTGCSESVHDVLVTGLVELCKVKPVGVDAVQWLGEWLLNNNPNQPRIIEPDDE